MQAREEAEERLQKAEQRNAELLAEIERLRRGTTWLHCRSVRIHLVPKNSW